MLTAQGQRQRYLIGQMNREKYIKGLDGNSNLHILDQDYLPAQIYIQSTSIYRALQSGYAELHGFYPPGER